MTLIHGDLSAYLEDDPISTYHYLSILYRIYSTTWDPPTCQAFQLLLVTRRWWSFLLEASECWLEGTRDHISEEIMIIHQPEMLGNFGRIPPIDSNYLLNWSPALVLQFTQTLKASFFHMLPSQNADGKWVFSSASPSQKKNETSCWPPVLRHWLL